MSAPRPPMPPPELPGYLYQRVLGSGGYSDVFLYEQQMPRRPVAIKVLVAEALDGVGRRQFTDEANSMAAVSTHPFIVTIFHAEIGAGGHPYLVMEFYPRPNYSVRARTEQLAVSEVIRTGIQVASAVETAHRAGILHRDIKPANILTSEYGRPGLTDFGIASTAVDGVIDEAAGMSIPWSPPEVISGSAIGDHTADVYSLGATIYTLLAGRSPFEIPGGSNRSLDLIERIERSALPPTGRGDAPASLERLLRQTMSKRPADRPSSAAAFARALQEIEVEQQFAMTALEVRDEGLDVRSRGGDEDGDGTRLKNPVVIHSQAPLQARVDPADGAAPSGPEGGTVQRPPGGVPRLIPNGSSVPSPVGGSPLRPPPTHQHVQAPVAEPSPLDGPNGVDPGTAASAELSARPQRNKLVLAAIAVLVLTVILVGVSFVADLGTIDTPTTTIEPPTTYLPPPDMPSPPTGVRAERTADGRLELSWSPGADEPDDYYVVTAVGGDPSEVVADDGSTSVTLPPTVSCARVVAVRANSESQPSEACVETSG